jgi:hypothetical protein
MWPERLGVCTARSNRRFSIATSITASHVFQADTGPHISAQHPRRSEKTDRGIALASGSIHNPERRLLCPLASLPPNVSRKGGR